MASGVLPVDLRIGAPGDRSLDLPASLARGYYELITVMAYGASDTGNAVSAAGVIHVVAAP